MSEDEAPQPSQEPADASTQDPAAKPGSTAEELEDDPARDPRQESPKDVKGGRPLRGG